MRDIKFRMYHLELKNYFENGTDINSIAYNSQFEMIDLNRVLWEQYTGLKDKNGIEIYENDIIEIFDMSYGDSDKHYGVVKYSEYAELVVGNILLSRVYKSIKVIGNIHENADLLEE